MQHISLIISESEIKDGQIIIKKLSVIDRVSGKVLKEAKINDDALKLLQSVEINITDYFNFLKMSEKNPNLKKLVNNFNLILI